MTSPLLFKSRPRRNRIHGAIRDLVREHIVLPSDLIAPLFILDQKEKKEAIATMPGQYRLGEKELIEECRQLLKLGIRCVALFPVIPSSLKNPSASFALQSDLFYYQRINLLKNLFPDLAIMTDVALDPYSSDGHDGLVDPKNGEILNDETLEILAKMSCLQAKAGADIIGPSDMMDGRVGFIREHLEKEGYKNINLMAYTAKYASAFYGPFRDALDSAPKKGDKKSYQMDYANKTEAYREALLDSEEGADILMVKPGLPYLDIISYLKEKVSLPIAAYNVSGEYAMVKGAVAAGWANEEKMVLEILTSFKRAGAQIILTYHAKDAAQYLGRI